ncbi:MAG: class I SAM-dependent methyltransferase [Proteobacteria bacterium]|nr:class I SAM-dependent methyltransferase [Pseudomonadota bacterium]NOG60496.1 class I SAM-dependent methyltransferase [Pseudomonadota bacterium]
MEPSPKFWNIIASRYSKQAITDEAAYQKKLKVTQEYFKPDMEVLEFGCGTGSTAIIHAPFVKHIRAIDFSAKMIDIVKAKLGQNNISNITFEQNTIEAISIKNESYDVVMGHSILHLLKDKEAVIARVYKLLKPGGFFVSSTVCVGNTTGLFKYIAPCIKYIGLPWLTVFTSEELIESISSHGFSIDYQWCPDNGRVAFIIGKKPE